ncbi:MAG: membrane complex biogenesis BtpA family protein, partial [Planctomycetota bacterium]
MDAKDVESIGVRSDLGAHNALRDRLRNKRPLLIGVVHLRALPGSPGAAGRPAEAIMAEVLMAAEIDARALLEGGADGIVVENFGDAPFFASAVPPETVAAMAIAVKSVTAAAPGLPVGVNVLRNDARSALGLCAVTGASFLRVNVHVGAMVTDQGLLTGQAAETMRSRAALVPGAL